MAQSKRATVTNLTPSTVKNRQLRISTGKTVTSNAVSNRKVTWDQFIERLHKPTNTGETFKQYMKYDAALQDRVKDVGYYVFGHYAGGIRKKGNLEYRDAVTLDIDHADEDWSFDLPLAFGDLYFVVHSTHKHSPDSPRLRQIFPLTRPVDAAEYEAIARKLAARYDIDSYDKTTFQFSRVMHWPSHADDGEYLCEEHGKKWVNPQDILDEYDDWRDMTQWPKHEDLPDLRPTEEKAPDPRNKHGWVGAFCRTYPISIAIETFLGNAYRWDSDTRLTYTDGSTANGAVIYDDDLFLYSHHESDPAGGALVNAFDLVRLHLFGAMDQNSREGTPVHRLPSYSAMTQWIDDALPDVKSELIRDTANRDTSEFQDLSDDEYVSVVTADMPPEPIADLLGDEDDETRVPLARLDYNVPAGWETSLHTDQHGYLKKVLANVVRILMYDKDWGMCVRYNEFACAHVVTRDLPQHLIRGEIQEVNGDTFTDRDATQFKLHLEKTYDMPGISKEMIWDAVEVVGTKFKFHPVRAYLEKLPDWDGTPRLDTLLIDYLGSNDTEYVRAVTRKTLCAAVTRIEQPGCKWDQLLVLEGVQGIRKSTFLRSLAKNDSWFCEGIGRELGGEKAVENMQSKWIIELPEGEGIIDEVNPRGKSHVTKGFLSKQTDRMRPKYGRVAIDYPRQSVFIMTTNESSYLVDETGNRRFWPVKCPAKSVDLIKLRENLDQIWAEARYRVRQGEPLWLPDRLAKEAEKEQKARELDDGLVGRIELWLSEPVNHEFNDGTSQKGPREVTCVREVWTQCFGEPESKMTRAHSNKILAAMKRIEGWTYRPEKLVSFTALGRQRPLIKDGGVYDS